MTTTDVEMVKYPIRNIFIDIAGGHGLKVREFDYQALVFVSDSHKLEYPTLSELADNLDAPDMRVDERYAFECSNDTLRLAYFGQDADNDPIFNQEVGLIYSGERRIYLALDGKGTGLIGVTDLRSLNAAKRLRTNLSHAIMNSDPKGEYYFLTHSPNDRLPDVREFLRELLR